MRLVKRNLKSVWYCLYNGRVPVIDGDGYETGETEVSYSDPVLLKANVSPATGQAQSEMFGTLEDYDKVIITDDMNCPIDENSVLYVDREPDQSNQYDYIVKRVAKSLNHISIAISRVKVTGHEQMEDFGQSGSGEHQPGDPGTE